jgi:hypothetical protein
VGGLLGPLSIWPKPADRWPKSATCRSIHVLRFAPKPARPSEGETATKTPVGLAGAGARPAPQGLGPGGQKELSSDGSWAGGVAASLTARR